MNTAIGSGVVGIILFLLGMTMSNVFGLLLGFVGGMLVRFALITLQWEGVYALGITSVVLMPSMIESNPFTLIGLLVGCFALEPLSAGMKYITNESSSLELGSRIELESLTRDGRVPTHMYAYYGLMIIPLLVVILVLGLQETIMWIKPLAFGLSMLVNVCVWVYKCVCVYKKGGGKHVGSLLIGLALSLSITVLSVGTYQWSEFSVYGVILPLVLMSLPLGKQSHMKGEVLPDMLSSNTPVHGDNFITCMVCGLINSVLISTSQRQVTKVMTDDPYNQYGIEAVCTYIQFGLFFLMGWGKTGETSVMKVISSYQSLDVFHIAFLLILLCGVMVYTLVYTRELMVLLIRSKGSFTMKSLGELVCIGMCVLIVMGGPGSAIGVLMLMACGMANVLMRLNIIPSEAMMGALLIPYVPLF